MTPLFVLFLVAAGSAGAQDRFRNFAYDSVFHIGGHAVGLPRLAKDSLRMDFTYTYGVDLIRLPYILGDSLDPNVNDTNSRYEYWHDTLERNFYRDADDAEFGLIFNPGRFHWQKSTEGGAEVGSVSTCDNYAWCDSMQFMDFSERDTAARLDTVGPERRVFKMTVSSSSSDSDRTHLIVGSPRYVTTSAYWIGNRDVYRHLALQRGLHGDDSLALLDSAHFMRFAFSFRADSLEAISPHIDDTVEIARIVMYRPFDTLIGACQCHINDAFMRVPITAGMFRDPDPDVLPRDTIFHEPLRTLSFWLDMRGGHIDTNYAIDSGYAHQAHLDHRVPVPGTDSACRAQRAALMQSLIASGRIGAASDTLPPVEGSEIHFRFYTTRRAPVTFLRSRAAMHQFEMLASGGMDDWLRQEIDTLWKSPALDCVRRRILHLGYYDEPDNRTFAAMPLLSRKIQQFTNADTPGYKATLFANPTCNWDGYRVFTGDCDTTSGLKPIHLMVRQEYMFGPNGMIPVRYANPDHMDDTALATFYPDSGANRIIAFSTMSDYQAYTLSIQDTAFGRIRDRDVPDVTSVRGPMVPYLARGVDVARFKYREITRDSMPVWNVVRVAGWFEPVPTVNGLRIAGNRWGLRPCTPEEVTSSCWLSLNAGSAGILYQDLIWDGRNFGVYDKIYGVGRIDRALPFDSLGNGEYDRTSNPSPDKINDPWYLTPKMWLGFRTRFDAIRRINTALRDTILPVYEKLAFAQEQMSVHDTAVSFATFPMLDTVRARRCWRYELDSGSFKDTTAYDSRESTYLEVTHFRPGLRDSLGRAQHARYLLFTNRRTWPIDTLVYSARTTRYNPGSARGLGYFDVRRPVIRLKNSTDIMADSATVEKIGDTTWRRTVRFGESLDLAWLEPGWGALYRITPIPLGIDPYGTAWNNAVHAENPGTREDSARRLFVYSRDSIVYLRTMTSGGTWSGPIRISDSADATPGWWRNFHPSVATVRNGKSCMAVWERRNVNTGVTSVEALWIVDRDSITGSGVGDHLRFRAAGARTVTGAAGALGLAPSLVGLDSGYVVAFPTAGGSGVSVLAVQDEPYALMGETGVDTTSVHGICWTCQLSQQPPTIASAAYLPSLAYYGNSQRLELGGWSWWRPNAYGVLVQAAPTDTMHAHVAHMAWQQGALSTNNAQHIFYDMIGVTWRRFGQSPLKPHVAVSRPEHVSRALPGCAFLHPSIAVDSLRVGVAFQAHSWLHRRVVLRFRDTISVASTPRNWNTPAYSWHDSRGRDSLSDWYEWPSLTQFPAADSSTRSAPTGAVAWFRTDVAAQGDAQYLYRFGWTNPERIANGQYPGMVLASRETTSPMAASGVLYRGDTTTATTGARPYDTVPGVYHPAMLIHRPDRPSSLFSTASTPGVIHGVDLRQVRERNCEDTRIGDLRFGVMTPMAGMIEPYDPEPDAPALPPSFFDTPEERRLVVESLGDAPKVARTSVFTAGANVFVRRHVSRSFDALDWLDSAPYDSALASPGNVWIHTELLRATDSAVLWRGDTISVRDMSSDSLEELVEIPVDTVAAPGTPVFARLRAVATAGLEYELSGHFEWVSLDGGLAKLVRRGPGPAVTRAAPVLISVIPNPASRQTTVRIGSQRAGELRVGIYDERGTLLGQTEPAGIETGEYALSIDVATLAPGSYTVQAEVGTERATARFVVVR